MTEPEFIEAEWKSFEAWAVTTGQFCASDLGRWKETIPSILVIKGRYENPGVDNLFIGWLARARENTVTEDMVERAAVAALIAAGYYPASIKNFQECNNEEWVDAKKQARAAILAALQPGDRHD